MAVRKVGFRDAVEPVQGLDGNVIAQQAVKAAGQAASGNGDREPAVQGDHDKFYVLSDWPAKREFSPQTLEHLGRSI
jgi:hypothetical protein